MLVEDPFQIADDLGVPTHRVGMVHLLLHGRKRRHPRDAAVAHADKLVLAHEETMLDGIHAAFNGVLDACVAGRMREGLPVEGFGGGDEFGDFGRGHLRVGGDRTFFEIDDAGGDELDAVGAGVDAFLDAGANRGAVLQRFAHETAVAALVMNGRAGAVEIRHQRTPVACI